MFSKLWNRLVSALRNSNTLTKSTKSRSVTLRLESLEERLTPAVDKWTGGGGNALWSTAANWSAGEPTSSSDVVFTALNNVASSMQTAYSINSLTIEAGYTQTITLSGDMTISNGGEMHDGTLFGNQVIIQASSKFFLWDGGTISTQFTINSNATLKIEASANAKIVTGGGESGDIQNSGLVLWQPACTGDSVDLQDTAGIYNYASSRFNIMGVATTVIIDSSDNTGT